MNEERLEMLFPQDSALPNPPTVYGFSTRGGTFLHVLRRYFRTQRGELVGVWACGGSSSNAGFVEKRTEAPPGMEGCPRCFEALEKEERKKGALKEEQVDVLVRGGLTECRFLAFQQPAGGWWLECMACGNRWSGLSFGDLGPRMKLHLERKAKSV